MKIKLELEEEQVQRILICLGDFPYKTIADVVNTIKEQANSQLTTKTNE